MMLLDEKQNMIHRRDAEAQRKTLYIWCAEGANKNKPLRLRVSAVNLLIF